jgi:hypothetical protein
MCARSSVEGTSMEFGILGPVEVLEAGRRLRVAGPKERALLTLQRAAARAPPCRCPRRAGAAEGTPVAAAGPRRARQLTGGAQIAVGTCPVVWSVWAARHVNLARPRPAGDHRAVRAHPQPHVRRVGALHAGAGMAAGSGWILAALPAAAALVHRQVRHEEYDLGADFGYEFARYQAAVPRYLGPQSFHRQG